MNSTKHRSGKRIRRGLLILFGISFAVGAFMSGNILLERKAADDAYASLRMNAQTAAVTTNTVSDKTGGTEDPKETTPDGISVPRTAMDFSPLKKLCPNIKGWLFAEGTNIDYPVVQTDNNDYYLKHLYTGESNSSGSLFLDYRNTGLFTDQNTVIYGHHMKNGTMFGSLELYKEQDFYDKYPTMLLYTPIGNYLIELICGTVENGNYEFVRFNFNDEKDFYDYIDARREKSTFQSNVEIAPGDRIISLCTCSYEWNNARYMIMGKLTPIMEDSTR